MAGGKETPRQKLIGMMYLVLLALLALQVGAEIMVKFSQLNTSLGIFVNESQEKSEAILSNIATKVAERGNKPKEVKALEEAQGLHEKSSNLIAEIEKIKQELIEVTGGRNPENNSIIGVKDTDKSSLLLLGQGDKKDGAAYKLEKDLNEYIDYLNVVAGHVAEAVGDSAGAVKKYPKLALAGKDDPIFVDQNSGKELIEGAKTKDFAHLNFDHTPMIASLAFLTEKQAKVATYEGEILEQLKAVVGAADFKFDKVFAMVRPESKVIAAGTEYKAEMFISASSDKIQPKMTFGGRSINVIGGMGKVKFKASAGNYDKEGKAQKSWTGTITIKKPTGSGDTTFKVVEKYTVTKPVIQVQSASVSALYNNCGNELNIQVPALGSLYDPSFSATGGTVQKGAKKGLVTIIPNGARKVAITVNSGGAKIGTETFKVRQVPKPTIVAYGKGKPVDQKKGMKAPGPRSIKMKAIADASFKEFLPKDARFRVSEWEVMLVRGKRPLSKKKVTSSTANLSAFAAKARPGDRILIDVKEVKRKNYLNKDEVVKIPTTIINIPLTD
ncbi:MAG: gliding motility protein GldM [Cytophagales bacterium]|nr:gliding motility protein GldM [Cytophagales bacterium]